MSVPIDRLCIPGGAALTRAPFVVRLPDATVWRCASDSHALIALRVDPSVAPTEPADAALATVAGWIAQGHENTVLVSLADLRAFAGEAVWDWPCRECSATGTRPACERCSGAGRVTATCDECDHEHEHDCEECGGKGKAGPCEGCAGTGRTRRLPLAITPGEVVGVAGCTLDVRLLAAVLTCAPDGDGPVTLARDERVQSLVLRGDGWYGRIMEVLRVAPARRFAGTP